VEAGHRSHEAFSRAFARAYGRVRGPAEGRVLRRREVDREPRSGAGAARASTPAPVSPCRYGEAPPPTRHPGVGRVDVSS
jgi:hypothetical protein